MKKAIYIGVLASVGLSMVSCDDFLDKNRNPLDMQISNTEFWDNNSNVVAELNELYNNYHGYGRGDSYGQFYFKTLSDDQDGGSFATWTNTNVPASSTDWNSPFEQIRHCTYIITNVRTSSLSDDEKTYAEAVAKLNRAHQYYQLVRMYGDVQWINEVIDPSDEELVYAARDNRDVVMDSVLNDLNYAIAVIPAGAGKQVWSKEMAAAMKSDICLFEGTYCKYRTTAENGYAADATRANKYLQECVNASEYVLGAGYTLNDNYQEVYNSLALSGNSEVIFYKEYEETVLLHSLIAYTCSSTAINGLTKDFVDSYLFRDGKPLALTSLDTDDAARIEFQGVDAKGKPISTNDFSIQHMLDVRDARMSMTTDPCVYFTGHTWIREGSNPMTSSTGYGVRKYDNPEIPVIDRTNTLRNYTDAPVFWLPVVMLNLAEAKAELGTLSDSDIDATLNKLYARAELPAQTLASLSGMNDPANNMGVSSLIWEVRRCRRCELVMDNWFRYWDLIRWHQLELLDTTKHPAIVQGANVSNYKAYVDAYNAAVDAYNATVPEAERLDKLSMPSMNGNYIDGSYGKTRTYEARQYLYPVPTNQLSLNKNLEQNPLWK